MSSSAHVNLTRQKKKQSQFKPQKNTLDRYFQAPKESSKPLIEDNLNVVTRSKRKIVTANDDGIKTRKKGEEKTQKNDFSSCNLKTSNKSKRFHEFCQKENDIVENITPLQTNDNSETTEANGVAAVIKKSFDLALQSSANVSVVIEQIDSPKLNQTLDYKQNILSGGQKIKRRMEFSNGANNVVSSPEDKVSGNCTGGHQSPHEGRKKISASSFKDIVYSFCHNEFLKPYQKLSSKLPQCYDLQNCRAMHEGVRLKEVNSYQYGHVFNMLDSPLSEWLCDILPAISLVLNRKQYLRGDMLRIMFDYILNGPNEYLMWDIKSILESHWSIHPPCSEFTREVYLQLLDRRYTAESYFRSDLTNCGVLQHVMDRLEKVLKTKMDVGEHFGSGNQSNDNDQSTGELKLTFEVLEERFNKHLPLFEEEQQEVMETIDELANSSQIERELVALEESDILNRLTIALEVIVDLLEADFMICVSRLKSYMKEECEMREPLIKHFLDDIFQSRILKYYVATTNRSTWKQLSKNPCWHCYLHHQRASRLRHKQTAPPLWDHPRLIGLVAETIHLFRHWEKKMWKYPNLHPDCENFASAVFEEFNKSDWSEGERLSRLQTLRPPWLQQRVSLAVANSHLNLDLKTGIHAVVEIIHTHVISPVKLDEDLKKIEPDPKKLKMLSGKELQKSRKKNQYGETRLHQLCRMNKFTVEELECELALADTDVNARDNNGWTPLHEAVNKESLPKVVMLLQFQPPPGSGRKSVEVGVQNDDGITPLHEAVEANNLEICQLLVQYGGVCLLKKMNNEGMTPLRISELPPVVKNKKNEKEAIEKREQIRKYFKAVIKIQEELNLNSSSVLKLSDTMIRMCMMVCEAFIADHHTWELYQVLKFDKDYDRASPQPWVAASTKDILLEFKQEQHHFRKLRKILEKLAENPENSCLIRMWSERFKFRC